MGVSCSESVCDLVCFSALCCSNSGGTGHRDPPHAGAEGGSSSSSPSPTAKRHADSASPAAAAATAAAAAATATTTERGGEEGGGGPAPDTGPAGEPQDQRQQCQAHGHAEAHEEFRGEARCLGVHHSLVFVLDRAWYLFAHPGGKFHKAWKVVLNP